MKRVGKGIRAGLACIVTGCSLAAVTRPSLPIERGAELDCTQSNVAPALDLGTGLGFLALGVLATSADPKITTCAVSDWACSADHRTYVDGHVVGGLSLGVAALAIGSAIYGFSTTDRCREVSEALRACREGRIEACGGIVLAPAEDRR